MLFKFTFSFLLVLVLTSCEDLSTGPQTERITDNLEPTPSNLPLNFSSNEESALRDLCSSFSTMEVDFGVRHDFSYIKNECSQEESYSVNLNVDIAGNSPIYSSSDRSIFYFPEIRFDLDSSHPISTYCSRINSNSGIVNRFIDIANLNIRHTLEVLRGESLRNNSSCFDSKMLAANSSNALTCLRIWTNKIDSSGKVLTRLTYETATFVVSGALRAHSGFTVHREKHNYLYCTDKKKSKFYKATRLK